MQNSLHKILLGLMQIAESGAFEGIIYSVISFLSKQTNCKIIIFISFFALKIDSVEIFFPQSYCNTLNIHISNVLTQLCLFLRIICNLEKAMVAKILKT